MNSDGWGNFNWEICFLIPIDYATFGTNQMKRMHSVLISVEKHSNLDPESKKASPLTINYSIIWWMCIYLRVMAHSSVLIIPFFMAFNSFKHSWFSVQSCTMNSTIVFVMVKSLLTKKLFRICSTMWKFEMNFPSLHRNEFTINSTTITELNFKKSFLITILHGFYLLVHVIQSISCSLVENKQNNDPRDWEHSHCCHSKRLINAISNVMQTKVRVKLPSFTLCCSGDVLHHANEMKTKQVQWNHGQTRTFRTMPHIFW